MCSMNAGVSSGLESMNLKHGFFQGSENHDVISSKFTNSQYHDNTRADDEHKINIHNIENSHITNELYIIQRHS